jgi:hypothetical protein
MCKIGLYCHELQLFHLNAVCPKILLLGGDTFVLVVLALPGKECCPKQNLEIWNLARNMSEVLYTEVVLRQEEREVYASPDANQCLCMTGLENPFCRRVPKLSINFVQILSRDHGNFEGRNKALEFFHDLFITVLLLMVIIII